MWLTGVEFSSALWYLPIVVVVELLFLAGLGLAFAALNVYFRDIQHILGNFMTLWFFLSPIIYPATSIPAQLRFSLLLNPIAIFTQMYHGMFLNEDFPDLNHLALVAAISAIVYILGNWVFNYYREEFAELV